MIGICTLLSVINETQTFTNINKYNFKTEEVGEGGGRRIKINKKHSENADTSFVKVKKSDVIRCRLLYCTLVPGVMSMGLLIYEISTFVNFM